MPPEKSRALYILAAGRYELIYGPEEREEIASLVEVIAPQQTRESIAAAPELLARADLIFSGWGGPRLDAAFLAAAPNLKVIFYGAGTVRYMVTEALWQAACN